MNKDIYFEYQWRYKKEDLKFCPRCGNHFSLEDLHIENQPQLICHHCKFIFYLDPKLVVTAIVLNKEKSKVLLLKRAEEPKKGLWAFSGGHVERGEDVFQAIKKEIREETGLEVTINGIIQTFSFSNDGTIELVFEAIADNEEIQINIESFEGQFFEFQQIPYNELAFSTTEEILNLYTKK